jgi:hypothetical protein
MEPVQTLLFLSLSLSITGILISDSLITFSNQLSNNSLALLAVRTFLFFLFPFTFMSAIILLILHVAMPQSAYINQLTNTATKVLVSAILLFVTPLMLYTGFTEAIMLDTLKFMLIGVAAVAIYKYNPFNRHINYARQTAGNLVPEFIGLCISASTFLLVGPFFSFSGRNDESTLGPIPIEHLSVSLNYLTYFLAMVLLFIRISFPTDGPQVAIPAVLIEYLVDAVLVMSFNIVLIGFCMIVGSLVGIF